MKSMKNNKAPCIEAEDAINIRLEQFANGLPSPDTRLIFIKTIVTFIFLTFSTITVLGTTWFGAYPYKQNIEGQKVTVEAYPFDPYSGSPMIGITKVYYDNKLLYSIDKYYREAIFTSNDGRYLAIVFTTNTLAFASYTTSGKQPVDFNQSAIEIFKDGKPFKTLTLKDVIDTAKLATSGQFYSWGYYADFEAIRKAESTCNSCRKVYGEKVLRKCKPHISAAQCEKCRNACNLAKEEEIEKNLLSNSIYVQNNNLFVLTNQNTIVKLDFSIFEVTQNPFDKIIPNKKEFNPPKLLRKYKKVKLPDHFDQPTFKDGRDFDKGIADILGMSVSENDSEIFIVFIHSLLIDFNGNCINFEGDVYDKRISKYYSTESINIALTEKLKYSLKAQKFKTNLIPKGFEGYSFLCIVNLK